MKISEARRQQFREYYQNNICTISGAARYCGIPRDAARRLVNDMRKEGIDLREDERKDLIVRQAAKVGQLAGVKSGINRARRKRDPQYDRNTILRMTQNGYRCWSRSQLARMYGVYAGSAAFKQAIAELLAEGLLVEAESGYLSHRNCVTNLKA